jgi:hypothetical protein
MLAGGRRRPKAQREIVGTRVNQLVGFPQCPDDIKLVALAKLPAHLKYTGISVYLWLLPDNHVSSSHWDGRSAARITPDHADGYRRTCHCGEVVDGCIWTTTSRNPREADIAIFGTLQSYDGRSYSEATNEMLGIEIDLKIHRHP